MSKPNLIVIFGNTGAGKTTLANELVKNGIEKIVTSTARPMREGEIDGIDYNFISLEEFKMAFVNDEFLELTHYPVKGIPYPYGSRVSDYKNITKDTVITLNARGVNELTKLRNTELSHLNIVNVYIDISLDLAIERSQHTRDDNSELILRYRNDKKDFDALVESGVVDIMLASTIETSKMASYVLNRIELISKTPQ